MNHSPQLQVVIVDDTNAFRIFRDHVWAAPQEDSVEKVGMPICDTKSCANHIAHSFTRPSVPSV